MSAIEVENKCVIAAFGKPVPTFPDHALAGQHALDARTADRRTICGMPTLTRRPEARALATISCFGFDSIGIGCLVVLIPLYHGMIRSVPSRFGSRSSGSHASLVLNRTMREGARDAAGSTRTGSASAVHRHRPDAVGWLDWARCRRRHRIFRSSAA